MKKRSVVDEVEAYLQDELQGKESITLKRNDIAKHFNCVPSQINYVINTRFSRSKGYNVESKRGGGGYIRIQKLYLCVDVSRLQALYEEIPNAITEEETCTILNRLVDHGWLNEQSSELLKLILTDELIEKEADTIRAKMIKKVIQRLQYK